MGFVFLQGRVSTKEVFGLPNSDLVPGVYEGEQRLILFCHLLNLLCFLFLCFLLLFMLRLFIGMQGG